MRYVSLLLLSLLLAACGGGGGGDAEPLPDPVSRAQMEGTWELDTGLSDPVREPIASRIQDGVLPVIEETIVIAIEGTFEAWYTSVQEIEGHTWGTVRYCDTRQTTVTFRDGGCFRDDKDILDIMIMDDTMTLDDGETLRVYVRVTS